MSRNLEQILSKTSAIGQGMKRNYAWWPSSTGRRTLIFLGFVGLLATIAIEVWIIYVTYPLDGMHIVRLQFSFTAEAYQSFVSEWGEMGRQAVIRHFAPDLVFPVAYGMFLFCTMSLALTPKPWGMAHLPAWRRSQGLERFRLMRERVGLRVIPIIAVVADFAENLLEWLLIRPEGSLSDGIAMAAGIVSVLKWLCIAVSLVIVLWSLAVQFLVKRGLVPLKG